MLVIDYGYSGPGAGDTLQALKSHEYVDVFASPGEVDITAHVDFTTLADAAKAAGAQSFGPVQQGAWLKHMGVDARIQSLTRTAPDREAEFTSQRDRLVAEDQMGKLFKVLGITAPHWPAPEGFGVSA